MDKLSRSSSTTRENSVEECSKVGVLQRGAFDKKREVIV